MVSCNAPLLSACRGTLAKHRRSAPRNVFPSASHPYTLAARIHESVGKSPAFLLGSTPGVFAQRDAFGHKFACQAVDTRDEELVADAMERDQLNAGRVPLVNWYPGHIAKAERQLKEQLRVVDVVLEVRDARIPISTSHPDVKKWIGEKPRLLLMNRADMVSKKDKAQWSAHFKRQNQQVLWTVGNKGTGIPAVLRKMIDISKTVNEKRTRRGLKARAVRACVVGFPNIGKSALINRLLKKRLVDSAPRPGVTRVLRWVRVGGLVDMLDSPGVIPANFRNQIAAQRLAMCNDIGQASYVDSSVASKLISEIVALNRVSLMESVADRYRLELSQDSSGEEFVVSVADRLFHGDIERAGVRILKDFRDMKFGPAALEMPWMLKS
ncbi:hypothetical protein BSKO_05797 [Bryopsis sp. KO-2023]|nr:hypothetical protein BSKO_05797 [Bryopsis sp. KO-2023]